MTASTSLPLASALALVSALSSAAQSPAQRVVPQSFEIASVKQNTIGGDSRRATASPGGRFTAVNVPLKLLISRAYGVPEDQIQGGPGWMDIDTFDITATANTPLEMSRAELRPCLQTLLAERFHLAVHRETKAGAVLSMIVAKKGSKLKEHLGEGTPSMSASSGSGKIRIDGINTTMPMLAEYLSRNAGRQVVDHTGLSAKYDFTVDWTTDETTNGPSLFSALAEQLGLQLVAARGPIDTIVIDRAEKPSAN